MSQESESSVQEGVEKSSRRSVLVAIPAGAVGSILSMVVTALVGRPGGQPASAPSAQDTRASEDVQVRLKTLEDGVKDLRAAFEQMRAAEHDRSMRERIMKDVEERFQVLEEAVRAAKPKR